MELLPARLGIPEPMILELLTSSTKKRVKGGDHIYWSVGGLFQCLHGTHSHAPARSRCRSTCLFVKDYYTKGSVQGFWPTWSHLVCLYRTKANRGNHPAGAPCQIRSQVWAITVPETHLLALKLRGRILPGQLHIGSFLASYVTSGIRHGFRIGYQHDRHTCTHLHLPTWAWSQPMPTQAWFDTTCWRSVRASETFTSKYELLGKSIDQVTPYSGGTFPTKSSEH